MTSAGRIMWIEQKTGSELVGPARIGRVMPHKNSWRTVHYAGKRFQSLHGRAFKANYYDVATHEHYWISGCRKDGMDALYSTSVEVDEDVRDEYWRVIRNRPDQAHVTAFWAQGKYRHREPR